MREIVRDLSDEGLNWKPSEQGEVNSIAQMLHKPKQQDVTIKAGKTTKVVIHVDTGIR